MTGFVPELVSPTPYALIPNRFSGEKPAAGEIARIADLKLGTTVEERPFMAALGANETKRASARQALKQVNSFAR